MAHYGELLNTYEPIKEEVYTLFVNYFNNPDLIKIKDVDNYSMYMVKTPCLLTNDYRYIIIMVSKDDNKIGNLKKMSDLYWISLQTRTLNDQHNIPIHSYQSSLYKPLLKKIERISLTKENSVYNCDDFPLRVLMIHRKPNINSEYHPTGNLISAIETYHTVITFTN
tara:strand:+ start:4970 stop:5470 length:501 start_codon:yes stop_codon:yes gene_type:complete